MASELENLWTSKQTCDGCGNWYSITNRSTNVIGSSSEVINEEWKDKYWDEEKPAWFKVIIQPHRSTFAFNLTMDSVEIELCDKCIKNIVHGQYGVGGSGVKAQEWFDGVMVSVRPNVANETESEVHDAEATPGTGSSGDS